MWKEVTGSRDAVNKLGKVTCLLMVLCAISVFPAMANKTRKNDKLVLSHNTLKAAAQDSVRGIVRDKTTHEPLPGANVYIKGTTIGVSTNAKGGYSLEVTSLTDTLMISYIGYEQEAVPIRGRRLIDIDLTPRTISGKQLVVIGYGTVQKKNLIGSVSQVSSEKFAEHPITRVDQAMQGQMSGVTVLTPTGQPGQPLDIRVRGEASISASNSPLYVVDGVPVNDITNLNPQDISSIEVLKDAASTAIYGSRGANGVVLITTKQGRPGQTRFTFNASYGVQNIQKYLDLLSPQEFINLVTQVEDSAWVSYGRSIGKNYKASDPISYRQQQLGVLQNRSYIPDSRWSTYQDSLAVINWQKAFYKQAPMQTYQLTATGGNNMFTYRVSGNLLNQDGIAIYTGFKRFSTDANFNAKLNSHVRLNLELSPSLSFSRGLNVDGKNEMANDVVTMAPLAEPNAGVYTGMTPYPTYYWAGSTVSPVAFMKYATNKIQRQQVFSKMDLSADLTKDLNLSITGSWNSDGYDNKIYYPTLIQHHNTGHVPGSLSDGRYTTFNSNKYLFQSLLNYKKTLGKNNLDALLGYSIEYYKEDQSYQRDTNFANDLLSVINNSYSTVNSSSTTELERGLISYFGRLTYNYNEKYLATVSLRRDGSSKFGANNKWGYFPAFSLGWRVSQESFLKSLTWLSNLKLRFSWGENGNNTIPDYVAYGALGTYNYSFDNSLAVGYGPSSLSNQSLGWEKTREADYGGDLGLFNNRVTLSVDYYDKLTTNLLLSVPVAEATGFSSGWENIGKVSNTGTEFDLHTLNSVHNFVWSTDFNLSFNHNKVLALGPGNAPIYTGFQNRTAVIEVGKPLYEFYLYDAIGVYKNQQDLQNSPHMSTNIPGDVQYRDVNGDGVINSNDKTTMGTPNPTFNWGLTNSFSYKNFDLSILIQGQGGNKIYSLLGRAIDRPGMGAIEALGRWRNRWISPSQPGNGEVPRIDGTTGGLYDSRWLYDATYWDIRNVTLGYNLPHRLVPGLASARIYITAENLYMHDHYYGGYNPDANNFEGTDYGGYPLATTYTVGINLGF